MRVPEEIMIPLAGYKRAIIEWVTAADQGRLEEASKWHKETEHQQSLLLDRIAERLTKSND